MGLAFFPLSFKDSAAFKTVNPKVFVFVVVVSLAALMELAISDVKILEVMSI